MRPLYRLLLLLVLAGCTATTPARPLATPAVAVTPAGPSAVDVASATRWLTDGPRLLDRPGGSMRGLRAVIDGYGHTHMLYQSSVEWMGPRNEGAVVVSGTTPGGDRYERRLWTAEKGFATNAIATWKGRVVVVAGTRPINAASGLAVVMWVSEDGGVSWSAPSQPLGAEVYQAEVAFTPSGQIVLVGGVYDGTFQTVIAVEDPRGWQIARPFGVGSGQHRALWMRDPTDPTQATLPALIALASTPNGFAVARSDDGIAWTTTAVASVAAWLPHLSAVGSSLVVVHEQYGRRGLTLARSDDGGATWTVQRMLVSAEYHAMGSPMLWDRTSDMVFLVLGRMNLTIPERRIVVIGALRTAMLDGDGAWTPDWTSTQAWMPLALPAGQTDQTRPMVAQRGGLAVVLWEGEWHPADWLRTKAVDSDFRPTSAVMLATLRLPALPTVWHQRQEETP